MADDLLLYIAIGFVAQMVDGAIGMAYGVTATSVLLGVGMPPATASACVHAAEVFTTATSGYAHWRLKNIDKQLVLRLALPGMIGGAAGAALASYLPGHIVRPFVNAYLLTLGLVIVCRALSQQRRVAPPQPRVILLGLFGGLFDAIGGGGWGAMTTTTLLHNGHAARYVIGSVNLAEFFVTLTTTLTFTTLIGLTHWVTIVGLIIGGVIAAPFAAIATKHLPDRALMVIVGVAVVVLSARGLLQAVV